MSTTWHRALRAFAVAFVASIAAPGAVSPTLCLAAPSSQPTSSAPADAYTPRLIFHRLEGNLSAIIQNRTELEKRAPVIERDLAAWYGREMKNRYSAAEVRQFNEAILLCDRVYEQLQGVAQMYREVGGPRDRGDLARQSADTMNLVAQDLLNHARMLAQAPANQEPSDEYRSRGLQTFDDYVRESPFLQKMYRQIMSDGSSGQYFSEANPNKAELEKALQEMGLRRGTWKSPAVIEDVISRDLKNALQAFQVLFGDAPEIEEGLRVWKRLKPLFNQDEAKAYGEGIDVLEQVYEIMKLAADAYKEGYETRNTDPERSRQAFKEGDAQQKKAAQLFNKALDLVRTALDAYQQARQERMERRRNGGWREEIYQQLTQREPTLETYEIAPEPNRAPAQTYDVKADPKRKILVGLGKRVVELVNKLRGDRRALHNALPDEAVARYVQEYKDLNYTSPNGAAQKYWEARQKLEQAYEKIEEYAQKQEASSLPKRFDFSASLLDDADQLIREARAALQAGDALAATAPAVTPGPTGPFIHGEVEQQGVSGGTSQNGSGDPFSPYPVGAEADLLAWQQWHKDVTRLVGWTCHNTLVSSGDGGRRFLGIRSRIDYTVTQDRHIVNVGVTILNTGGKSQALLQEYETRLGSGVQSLNNDAYRRQRLSFPAGSQRTAVNKNLTFTYDPNGHYTITDDQNNLSDSETLRP